MTIPIDDPDDDDDDGDDDELVGACHRCGVPMFIDMPFHDICVDCIRELEGYL